MPHRQRAAFSRHHPLHITLRMTRGLPSLRHRRLRKAVFGAIAAGSKRFGFRLVHFSLQSNHIHIVGEADDHTALRFGMQGLSIRIAKTVNRKLERNGTVFSDRYHVRVLHSPRETRNVLRYVLLNARHHHVGAPAGAGTAAGDAPKGRRDPRAAHPLPPRTPVVAGTPRTPGRWVDPCSSALLFDGFTPGQTLCEPGVREELCPGGQPITAKAESWLLTSGWRRHGPIDPSDTPGASTR